FGQLSENPKSAADYLSDSSRSLLVQSRYRRGNFQKDGWGVAYFQGATARVIRGVKGAFEESRPFRSAAREATSRAVLGHLRAASNPEGLPHRRLIGVHNSQPFADGRILFAHNGTVEIPREVARFLGPYRQRVRGVNDSEIYFWQFRKFYDA